MRAVGRGVEHDLHRHALHDLDEVAGRVLRRQQAEERAGAALDRLDAPVGLVDGRVAEKGKRVVAPA